MRILIINYRMLWLLKADSITLKIGDAIVFAIKNQI
jgi:hypothetical protein